MFHPVVAEWVRRRFGGPTPAQAQAWPLIAAGRGRADRRADRLGQDAGGVPLRARPPGPRRHRRRRTLPDRDQVLYVSPLKALSNDVQQNLEQPLAELRRSPPRWADPAPEVRTAVRTGDTPRASARDATDAAARPRHHARVALHPAHLGRRAPQALQRRAHRHRRRDPRGRARQARRAPRALARAARGTWSAPATGLQRIGLSATQSGRSRVAARFLVGAARGRCRRIVDVGHRRDARPRHRWSREDELGAVCHATSSGPSSTTASPRWRARTARRWSSSTRGGWPSGVAPHLGERLGEDSVAAHHGSLSRERRHRAEQRSRRASCASSSPPPRWSWASTWASSISAACSARRGRSRRCCSASAARATRWRRTPKGRLFPLTRDQLVECAALVRAARRGELDAVALRRAPARRPGAAGGRRLRQRGVGRGRALRAVCARAGPYARAHARRLRRGRRHAGGGRRDQPRAVGRAPAPRRREPPAARRGAARGSRRSPRAAPSPTTPTTT